MQKMRSTKQSVYHEIGRNGSLQCMLFSLILGTVVCCGSHSLGEEMVSGETTGLGRNFVTAHTTIGQLLENPAFAGFGYHLLTRRSDVSRLDLPLREVRSLLPYHSSVDTDTVVASINHMIRNAGTTRIFYPFYSDQEIRQGKGKADTGLFFFRGTPGAPFAVICPGGGFSYVGSFHEGFPYAMELSKRGYNAFVLRYRVGGGATPAVRDLAAALSFIFRNADALEVASDNYSLWGSSAGARMVAYIGTHGTQAFGGDPLPKPSTIVMAYTGHSEFSPNDPPTFAVIGDRDGIASPAVMERRIKRLQDSGVDAELSVFRNVGHGFGLGVGTSANGWIQAATQFWEKHISK